MWPFWLKSFVCSRVVLMTNPSQYLGVTYDGESTLPLYPWDDGVRVGAAAPDHDAGSRGQDLGETFEPQWNTVTNELNYPWFQDEGDIEWLEAQAGLQRYRERYPNLGPAQWRGVEAKILSGLLAAPAHDLDSSGCPLMADPPPERPPIAALATTAAPAHGSADDAAAHGSRCQFNSASLPSPEDEMAAEQVALADLPPVRPPIVATPLATTSAPAHGSANDEPRRPPCWRSCVKCGVYEPFQYMTDECCWRVRRSRCRFAGGASVESASAGLAAPPFR